MNVPIHPSGLHPEVVAKVWARRGRLHAFPAPDPTTAALIVVDLDAGTIANGTAGQPWMAERVNALAVAFRSRGGTVAWVTTPIQTTSPNYRAVFGDELADGYEAQARSGQSATIWEQLQPQPTDVHATKQGHSAFFPGKSNLHDQLQARSITSLFVVGTVTNVCCESSARDAAELSYQVTLVSDAMVGQTPGLHEPTLWTFYRCFGDVRPTANVIQLLGASTNQKRA